MRILITGGSGFIGRNMARRLSSQGIDAMSVDNLSVSPVVAPAEDVVLRDVRSLTADDLDADIVLHFAALKSVPESFTRPDQMVHNLTVDDHILRAFCASTRPRRLVLASSCEVYGDQSGPSAESRCVHPRSPYSVGKAAMENLVRVYADLQPEKEFCVLRLHNVFGPDEGADAVIPKFIDSVRAGMAIPVEGDGLQARDFTYIDDACDMIAHAVLDSDPPPPILNIGSGTATTIHELCRLIAVVSRTSLQVKEAPARPNEVREFIADMTLYSSRYGSPATRSLAEGIAQTVRERSLLLA